MSTYGGRETYVRIAAKQEWIESVWPEAVFIASSGKRCPPWGEEAEEEPLDDDGWAYWADYGVTPLESLEQDGLSLEEFEAEFGPIDELTDTDGYGYGYGSDAVVSEGDDVGWATRAAEGYTPESFMDLHQMSVEWFEGVLVRLRI